MRAEAARGPRDVRRSERGVVLVLVLVLALLLSGSVATFARRATLDAQIARNRDAVAEAEALARGGVWLGLAVLLEDLLREQDPDAPPAADGLDDLWARIRGVDLPLPGEHPAKLRLDIRDSGARLNLNALFVNRKPREDTAETYLQEILKHVIEEMPEADDEKAYDPLELTRNLVDYVDEDNQSLRGDLEDDYYQQQDPPYRAENRPLLSVDELRRVQGFDGAIVDALRPYVTVYPFVKGDGINLNTAPPHVLALVYLKADTEGRLVAEDFVKDLVRRRDGGQTICDSTAGDVGGCTSASELTGGGQIFPPPTYRSKAFTVVATATVGEVRRSVEVVIDRQQPASPKILAWRTY